MQALARSDYLIGHTVKRFDVEEDALGEHELDRVCMLQGCVHLWRRLKDGVG